MPQYDPKIIYEFTERLYATANSMIIKYTVAAALFGGIVGTIAGSYMNQGAGFIGLVGVLLSGGMGYSIGKEKAFGIKLQAQMALCKVKIEENTRKP